MKEIVVASGNKGKIKEVKDILDGYIVKSIKDYDVNIDVVEDKDTFEGNAIKKAMEYSKVLNGKLVLADDSGIMIDYLDGFPGVNTRRWLDGTDRDRNLGLIKKLEDVNKENRKIKFVTAIAVSNGTYIICELGVLEGYVSTEVRGDNGFGFDEIFELENGKTLAELTDEEKNSISARKIAIEKIKKELRKKLNKD